MARFRSVTRRVRSRFLRIAPLAVLLLATGGCMLENETWNYKQEDVAKAEAGWMSSQVKTQIGRPVRIEYGKGLATGWEEWVYPSGSIFLYRSVVKEVVPRPAGAETTRRRGEGAWPVTQEELMDGAEWPIRDE